MLTEKEFNVLNAIRSANVPLTQRELVEITGYSLGSISKIYNTIRDAGFVNGDYKILENGWAELERFRVNNAIILAAGITTDTNPISKTIPKGLYIVKGEILIERLIKQLQAIGIKQIYVVVGFRMEQFFYLEKKYGVYLIPNTTYMTRNNNGSLYCVRELLGNSYIIPNDEYFTDNVFSQYEYKSYYATVYTDSKTKESFVKLDDNNRILRVYKGGKSGWVMLGHSYLSKDFSQNYIKWLEEVYNQYETKKLFWEEIFYPHLNSTHFYAKKYDKDVIYEFDELNELQGFDNQFLNNINSNIYKLICEIFNASKNEITDIKPEKESDIDILFRFKVRNDEFVFRYPSKESTELINYAIEETNNKISKMCGVDESIIYIDRRGYKISMASSKLDKLDRDKCILLLKRLQDKHISTVHSFDYRERIRNLFQYFNDNQLLRISQFDNLKEKIFTLLTLIENDKWRKEFSHNNISSTKFRFCNANIVLIDWCFSGLNDIGYDIAALASIFSEKNELDEAIISEFLNITPEVKCHLYSCLAVSSYYKFLLGIYYSDTENEFSNNLYENWKLTNVYLKKSEDLFAQKYNKYLTNEQIKYIECKIREQFVNLHPLSGGVTNTTYRMITKSGKKYSLRIPGIGTNDYINRKDEMINISTIDSLGIIPKVTCADPKTGVLIMDYLENSQTCSMEDIYNVKSLQRICRLLYIVHTSEKVFNNEFDIPKNQNMYKEHFKILGGKSPEVLQQEEKRMDIWMSYLFLTYPKEIVTCHGDPKLNNFLKKGMKLYLIDWEYSGMADCYFELASFSLVNNLTENEEKMFLECYCQVSGMQFDREKFLLYKFATDYLWIYWHLIKCQQKSMVEYNEMSWKKRLKRAKKILDILEMEHKT